MGRPRLQGASFNPDVADMRDPELDALINAPVLFKQLCLACHVCGSRLTDQHYAFFPSSVFITGHCERCGASRTAIFAPDPKAYVAPVALSNDRANAEIDAFLAFLHEGDTPSPASSPEDDTTLLSAPDVFSGTHLDVRKIEPLHDTPQ